jgi:hypothetical protein
MQSFGSLLTARIGGRTAASSGDAKQSFEDCAEGCASVLGVLTDFKKIRSEGGDGVCGDFLEHLHSNLDLLISKTWVSKGDERRKIALQERIPGLLRLIEKKRYNDALHEFIAILEELAYLFFGKQSKKDDFIEYAMRIDPQFGLFWCYAGLLEGQEDIRGNIREFLLVGLCYLRNL